MSGTQRGEGWGQVEAKTLVVERGGDLLKADAAAQRPTHSFRPGIAKRKTNFKPGFMGR